ncbi:hypothetical protein BT63DRAFT_442096 [Microthyrium microscopicum]|uniref:L-ornithine N(5)-monooxygenase [NAD(P)H] n=1 Tax=Microthyrium microscopicum TaxID=703497 RepID=A0A6A6U723_9PEZI|nr:hypothetical protein BT63DRAFT_442096 [Microthyrium microscopicum]
MAATEVYDIVCVGFGSAALSLAIGLYEQQPKLKVLFLEKEKRFSWQGSRLPFERSKMQSNFMQDLVTPRNPLSKFTLVNYLWSTDMLVMYTNLSAINPPRQLFSNYLNWCAEKMETTGWVKYDQDVQSIAQLSGHASARRQFQVTSRKCDGQETKIRAKTIILSQTSSPDMPKWVPYHNVGQRIFHTSEFTQHTSDLNQWNGSSLNIAVVGGNDEALDIFQYCQRLDGAKITLLHEGPFLRLHDSNPFLTSLAAHEFSESTTQASIHPSVQHEQLHSLYEKRYTELVRKHKQKPGNSEIFPCTSVIGTSKLFDQIVLKCWNTGTDSGFCSDAFDYIFVSSRYADVKQSHLMAQLKNIIGRSEKVVNSAEDEPLAPRIEGANGAWILRDEYATGNSFENLALRTEQLLRTLTQYSSSESPEGYTGRRVIPETARL